MMWRDQELRALRKAGIFEVTSQGRPFLPKWP
jgi:hypothetical protein